MNTIEFLKKLPAAVDADAIDGVNCTIQLDGPTKAFVKVADGSCTVTEGHTAGADVTLKMSDENLMKLLTGELGGLMAYMTGKLQVEGDLMLAKEIPNFFDADKLAG